MLMPRIVRTVLLVASTLLSVPCCLANEGDPATEPSNTTTALAPTPARSLFSSWFGSKAFETQHLAADAADFEPPHSILPPGIPRTGDLVVGALGLLGIGYRFGGNTPTSGFDCSGLVRYVFQTTMGLDLPRRAEEISRVGMRIDRSELQPGDLVFYKTLRKTFSHVGIYLGNNRFIHAPSAGGSVRVDDMSEHYWTARFNGARRVEP